MKLRTRLLFFVGICVIVALVIWALRLSFVAVETPSAAGGESRPTERQIARTSAPRHPTNSEETQTHGNVAKSAVAEEVSVDAFDSLTDKWIEPATAKVDLKAVAAFVETFHKVPEARRGECIHRALNLIPDENVMLLAGVLMDKTMDKEIVETVYNDILNRDEDVKKPILQEIFKDKSHPCWADTAWILDVTGELPGKK